MKVAKTLLFMLRNPIPLIVHLTCWFLLAAWGVVADDPFMEGTWPYIKVIVASSASIGDFLKDASIIWDEIIDEIIEDLTRTGFWVLVVMPPFLICYREAVGNLKGRAKAHKVWMEWHHRQQEAITEGSPSGESMPPPENIRANSYFRKAQKTVLFLIRNPKRLFIHFLCWIPAYFLLILMTEFPDLVDIVGTAGDFLLDLPRAIPFLAIVAAIFGLISSYQETRGTVKGIAKVQQTWTAWYHRQQEPKVRETPFDVPPPSFNTF